MAVSQITMVAKGIMLLFPIGVVLALLYSGATFFRDEEVPAPVVAVVEPAPIEVTEPVIPDAPTSTDPVATSTPSTTTPQVTTPVKAAPKLPVSSTLLHLGIYGGNV